MNTIGELSPALNPYASSTVWKDQKSDGDIRRTLVRPGALYTMLIAIQVPVLHAVVTAQHPSFDTEFTGTTVEDVRERIARIIEDARKIPYDF